MHLRHRPIERLSHNGRLLCDFRHALLMIIAILLVFSSCLISIPPAHAENYEGGLPLTTVRSGVVSGGVYVDATPANFGPQEVTKTFALPAEAVAVPGRIAWARLYVSVYLGHMQNNYVTKAGVSLDGNGDGAFETVLDPLLQSENVPFNFIANGGNPPPSGGQPWATVDDHTNRVSSDYLMWYDVTGLLSGQYPAVHVDTRGSFDGRVKVITLVVAYNDGDDDQVYYWVNQGHDVDSYYMDYPMYAPLSWNDYIGTTSFAGIPAGFSSVILTVNHMASSDGLYTFGGQGLPRYSSTGGNSYVQGAYSGYDVWDATGLISGDSAALTYDRSALSGGTGEFSGQFYKIPLATLAIRRAPPPAANFSASITSGIAPLSVQFTDLSTNSPTAWAWDFDGDLVVDSTAQNPVHTYNLPGTYTVNLTASNAAGSSFTVKNALITAVLPPAPVAGFRANLSTGTSPLSVQFTDLSTNSPTAWAWDFGDGNVSSLQNPLHVYALAGNYDVRLTASNAGGSNTATIAGCILVVQPPPVAGFAANVTLGMAPLSVQFADQSAGAAGWAWDFDGDGIVDSTAQSPVHTFMIPGLYSVNLTVSNAGGSDSLAKADYILVTGRPVLSLVPSVRSAAVGCRITMDVVALALPYGLSNYSFNLTFDQPGIAGITGITGPEWALIADRSLTGDSAGIIASDIAGYIGPGETNVTLATVELLCEEPGTTRVQLASSSLDDDEGGTFGLMAIGGEITAYVPLEAAFNASIITGYAPLAVDFADLSAGTPGPASWAWDFGDGNVSSARNASHTFSGPGNYMVTLAVTNEYGNSTTTRAINVTARPPAAGFVASLTAGWTPMTVQFTDQSTDASSWAWDFENDGIVDSTLQNPSHVYNSSGNYTVKLTVTGPGGSNTSIRPGYINVSAAPPCDLAFYSLSILPQVKTVFAREQNTISLYIINNGPNGSPATEVELRSNDGFVGRAAVPALASGQQKEIKIVDTVIRQQAGAGIIYTATLDPDGDVYETNETNNVKTSPAWTVLYNGYKGKRYWAGGSDDNTVLTFDLHGDIVHSFGNSLYTSGSFGESGWNTYTVGWTAADLPIPAGATVRAARLYVPYTWDNSNVAPDQVHINFNGQTVPYQHWYHDVSNFGAYTDHVYGLMAYDVTSLFKKNTANSAVFTRDGSPTTKISMYGFTLAVVYEYANDTRKQIFLNEEFDLLGADLTGYATTPEEATAYYRFSGMTIDRANVTGARLVTFIPSGAAQSPDRSGEGILFFNGQSIGNDVWDYGSTYGPQVAVDSRDIMAWLQSGENIAGIRSTEGSTPCLAAAQGFLVVEYRSTGVANVIMTVTPTPSGVPTEEPEPTQVSSPDPSLPNSTIEQMSTVARTSPSSVPLALTFIILFTGVSTMTVFFVLNGSLGPVSGGAVSVGGMSLPLKLVLPALLIVTVLVAVAGGFVAGQYSSEAGPASPEPAALPEYAGPPNATFRAIPVVQDIRDLDMANTVPDYPDDFCADNGILFEDVSGDRLSLDKISIRLSSGGTEITLGPADAIPGSNCTTAGRYLVKTGGSGEVSVGPGEWFMLYADNCLDDSGSAEGKGGKALSWMPEGSSSPFVLHLGEECDYSIIDSASGSVIQQGTIRFEQ